MTFLGLDSGLWFYFMLLILSYYNLTYRYLLHGAVIKDSQIWSYGFYLLDFCYFHFLFFFFFSSKNMSSR